MEEDEVAGFEGEEGAEPRGIAGAAGAVDEERRAGWVCDVVGEAL